MTHRNRQSDTHRAASSLLLIAVAIALLPALSVGCSRSQSNTLGEYRAVEEFELVERSGRPVTLQDLHGNICVVNFFFAGCSVECFVVLDRMAELQQQLLQHTNTLLVSMTTDPRSDTPEALTRFAAEYDADPDRWLWLTGDKKTLYHIIVQSFLLPNARDYQERAALLAGLVHSDQVAVVDRRGVVRGYFDGSDPEMPHRVVEAVRQLETEPSSPAIADNALHRSTPTPVSLPNSPNR